MAKRNRKSQKRRKNQRKRGTRRRIKGGGVSSLHLVSYVEVYDDNQQTAVILEDKYKPSIIERGMATALNPVVKPLVKGVLQEMKDSEGFSLPDKVIFIDVNGKREPVKMKTYNFDLTDGEWIQISGPIINRFYGDARAEVLQKLNKGTQSNQTVIKNSLGVIIHSEPT